MSGMGNQMSLVDIIKNGLRQKGINAEVRIEGNKAYMILSETEARNMIVANMPKDLAAMITVEKVGEMILSIRLA